MREERKQRKIRAWYGARYVGVGKKYWGRPAKWTCLSAMRPVWQVWARLGWRM